jgi:hypothetical protein
MMPPPLPPPLTAPPLPAQPPPLSVRALTAQLADDLSWLEKHCRQRPDQARATGQLRLAAALVRNCIGPLLDDQPSLPLHIAVVGGAGAGKSTVANLLCGATAAEANPQAGFTRHPIAYTSGSGPGNWAGHVGFLGPLQRLSNPAPSSLDEDVYQVRRVTPSAAGVDLLKEFIVWDCPDMTTWAASNYIPRLLEASALADVLVYVASDERYNDEMPTQFLELLLRSGKPVVCCLMKMREADAPAIVDHFRKEVVSRMPPGVVGVLPIPYMTPAQLADPVQHAGRYRIPLVNQIGVLGNPSATARKRSVYGAMQYLTRSQDQLLSVARQDMLALQNWQLTVQSGHIEFDTRYYREYLISEKFRGFDEAMIRLMQLVELPGIGKVLSGALWVLRSPFLLLKGALGKAVGRPQALGRPEQPVLEEAFTGWIDLLRKEAARNAGQHPLWAYISRGFHSGALTDAARERFLQGLREFQVALADEVDQIARNIYEHLEKNPVLLNTLRTTKFGLEAGIIGATVASAGLLTLWSVPMAMIAASATQFLVELFGKGYVDSQRELTRRRQQELLTRVLSGPMTEWLIQWPATGGSEFERLQQVLRRIPANIQNLDARVRAALRS